MFNIGTAPRTGTIHATAGNSSNRGAGAQCNNRIGVRTVQLVRIQNVTREQVEEMRAAGMALCKRCFPVPTAKVTRTAEPATEYEEQGYPEWIDLIESVYVNAESRVHRDFSSQSGVQGFVAAVERIIEREVHVCKLEQGEGCVHCRKCGVYLGLDSQAIRDLYWEPCSH